MATQHYTLLPFSYSSKKKDAIPKESRLFNYEKQKSNNQHRIAIRAKLISLFHCHLIGLAHLFISAEC